MSTSPPRMMPNARVRRLSQRLLVLLLLSVLLLAWDRRRNRTDPSRGVRIAAVVLVDPMVATTPEVRAFMSSPDIGLVAMTRFFEAEYERLTGGEPMIAMETYGPFEGSVELPEASHDDRLWDRLMAAWGTQQRLRALSRQHGADFDAADIRVIVQLRAEGVDLASHSRASPESRTALVQLTPGEMAEPYGTFALIHEVGHCFGALDHYDPVTYLPVFPDGYAEPTREPLFPQRFADIMAVDIPTGPGSEREPASIEELRIGPWTAWEMGWRGRPEPLGNPTER